VRAFVCKYVPLGTLTMTVRVRSRDRFSATRVDVIAATVYEQVATIAAAATISSVALAASRERPPNWALALLVSLLAVLTLVPIAVVRLKRIPRPPLPRHGALASAVAVDCVAWVVAGAGAWIVVDAVSAPAPAPAFVIGAYALAWLAGFVVPFAPSGLGVREAMFAGMLAPQFGLGPATAIAVMLRFASTIGDLVAFAAVEAAGFAASRAVTRAHIGIS
jgi:uncharacterized membrane protein YbhN (UPF0104 family)